HPVHDGVQLELREALSGGRADPVKSLLDPRRTAVEAGGCPAPRARWPTLHIPRDADGVCHRGRELEDALSAAADEERNRRLLRSWPVLRGIHTEVPSPEQRSLPGTRLGKDLQGFGEPFQSLRHGPPAHPDSTEVVEVPAGADTQLEAAPGEDVGRDRFSRKQERVP